MYVDEARRIVFLAQPRCASRAIAGLMESHGAVRVGTHHGVDYRTLARLFVDGYMSLSVVRNPYDLIASFYHNCHATQPTDRWPAFRDWLPAWIERDGYVTREAGEYRLFGLLPYTDMILKLETMDGPLGRIYGTRPAIVGASDRQPITYDTASRELVRVRFGVELDLLGYGFPGENP